MRPTSGTGDGGDPGYLGGSRYSSAASTVSSTTLLFIAKGVARQLDADVTPGIGSLAIAAVTRLPMRLRYSVPIFPVLQARFRAAIAR